jgi:hypothetical protein
MVRQARTYFAGAVSGVTLIGIAIALFVVLVSAQVFHEWPIAALGFGHHDSAVAPAKSLGGERMPQTASTAKTSPATTRPAKAAAPTPTPQDAHHRHHSQSQAATAEDVTRAAPVAEGTSGSVTSGHESSSATPVSGSPSSSPTSSSSTSSAPSNSSSGGSNSASGSSASGSGSSGSSSGGSSGGSSSSGESSGGGSASGGSPVTETVETVSKTPANVAAGVNETVNNVDETALGGTLKETGVTEVTESVVNGVAGPETVVGKTVNGVGEVVGGLLGGGSH